MNSTDSLFTILKEIKRWSDREIIEMLVDFQDGTVPVNYFLEDQAYSTQDGALRAIEARDENEIADSFKILLEILRKLRIGYWERPEVIYDVWLFDPQPSSPAFEARKPSMRARSGETSLVTVEIDGSNINVLNPARTVGVFDLFNPDSVDEIYECLFGVMKGGAHFMKAGDGYLEELGPS